MTIFGHSLAMHAEFLEILCRHEQRVIILADAPRILYVRSVSHARFWIAKTHETSAITYCLTWRVLNLTDRARI